MEIRRVDSLANQDEVFLDASKLVEGIVYERVALVVDANAGLTRFNSGFTRFFLKDVNANVVCARLFDVKDFETCGIKLAEFRNKPVKLKFYAQKYNGNMSLVVDGDYGIKVYTGIFDRARFIGKYDFNVDAIVSLANWCFGGSGWKFPVEYGMASFTEIGQGRVGAFAKVMEMSFATLSGCLQLQGVNGKELIRVAFTVFECYYRLLKAKETYGFLEEVKAFDILIGIDGMDIDRELRAVIVNCVKPLANFGHATHLYSHLINSAVNNAVFTLELVLQNNSLIVGATTEVGGMPLSKF